MILYAAVVSGWVMASGVLIPFSSTVSTETMSYAVFAQTEEKCQETLAWAMESAESTGIYFGLTGKCEPRQIPEKPQVPTINPEDPVG